MLKNFDILRLRYEYVLLFLKKGLNNILGPFEFPLEGCQVQNKNEA